MNTEKEITTLEAKPNLSEQMIQKAFVMYMEREARREAVKAPHKEKVKKTRRAKNKVARKSRAGNR